MPDRNTMNPIFALSELVKHGTECRGEALVVMWDEEDGFFISTVPTGALHYPVKEIDLDARHATLEKAIDAAVAWHNEEHAGRQPYAWFTKIVPPTLVFEIRTISGSRIMVGASDEAEARQAYDDDSYSRNLHGPIQTIQRRDKLMPTQTGILFIE